MFRIAALCLLMTGCTVSEEMIGHKFGEFASTRKAGKHKVKKGKK